MSDKNTTKNKTIYDIADYIFANPDKNRNHILSYFAVKCRKDRRTIERYYKNAQEYNKERLQTDEKLKDEQRHAEIKDAVKMAILTRCEALEILSGIANEKSNKGNDRINAIQQMAKMEGWESATKINLETEKIIDITYDL